MATQGFFKIRRVDSKTTLKLKGAFDSDNIYWITRMLINRNFFTLNFWSLI